MTELLVYAVRHIPTDKLMPIRKNNRGYSFWTPDAVTPQEVPRLFPTRRAAANAITAWLQGKWEPVFSDLYEEGCIGAEPVQCPERKRGTSK